ncbi:alpha/beta-hydrolase [Karstenula rhodostoma CBS 690.94]|uniref:Alpha/beta-hydrolase n=1 Tax=Karstenula rhodostoma CBS 690.94 TaxID=1392251 RepID=A0A9P4U7E5_9PLEO|nr:alpha/beta-hydrolase [Karstenula rhodostoma CBS 690.94]
MQSIKTKLLEIHYLDLGPRTGWPVILSHGFPYSVHAYSTVAPMLQNAGARVIIPYTRGYGPTRFLSRSIMRSGQQAALATDIITLMDALAIPKALLAGFDWGGLASCAAAALFPERVAGLVSYAGYDIADVEGQKHAVAPALERVMWYQHLFQSERGRECLSNDRRALCKLLWEEWSPRWDGVDEAFEKSAEAFDNEDWVDVVVHCYRFHLGKEAGDPVLEELEERLAGRPAISVPTITLDGLEDPLKPAGSADHAKFFTGKHERWEVRCGHAFPLEAPEEFAAAVFKVHEWSQSIP